MTNALLTNGTLTSKCNLSKTTGDRDAYIAFLDLDPGQPEYSPPGQLSLVLLSRPNFGPPFSHPNTAGDGCQIVRAHSLAAITQSSDPIHYMECVIDLLSHYRSLHSHTLCPLIINTPGWILGTGLELLVNIIKQARPTEIIYMSQDGPRDVVETLRQAAESIPFLTLPSQSTEFTSRTAAHLRTMQYMSYFHLNPDTADLSWNSGSITSLAPWEVRYVGRNAGILGIMCLGEQPPPEMLRNTIDGTLVAIVVFDDMAAVPELENNLQNQSEHFGRSVENIESVESGLSMSIHEKIESLPIIRTPEKLPYLDPAIVTKLSPRYSHTIGLALVRGIDTKQRRLQLLSPVSAGTIGDIKDSGKLIILVSGKLDTPGWAYTEEMYKRSATSRGGFGTDTEAGGNDDNQDAQRDNKFLESDGFDDVPWTERLHGDEGRGLGAKVWRVRRDLGRTGNGD